MAQKPKAFVREVRLSDCEAVLSLKHRMGMPAESPERWRSLWLDNPANLALREPAKMGWVVEADGAIVGYLGSIPLLYWYRGKTLTAFAATSFAVEIPYRGYTLALAAAFLRQQGADLLLNTTASPAVGMLFETLRARRIPQADYNHILYFILDPSGFSAATLRKLGFGPRLADLSGILLGAVLRGYLLLRPQWRQRDVKRFEIDSVRLGEAGSEVDELWTRRTQESAQLLAYRTAAALRWHFAGSGADERIRILCCRRGGVLSGYAVVGRDDLPQFGLRRAKLYDLFVEADASEAIDCLLGAAIDWARAQGAHSLQMQGFPRFVRNRFLLKKPFDRDLRSWPLYFKALEGALEKSLAEESAWYMSTYDEDYSLVAGDVAVVN